MRLIPLMAALIPYLAVSVSHAAPWTGDEIRVLSYNIYHGGQDRDPVYGRNHEWLEVIRSRNPDVILIQEGVGWLPVDSNYVSIYEDSLNASFPDEPRYQGWVGDANSAFELPIFSRLPVIANETVRGGWLNGQWFYLTHGFFHVVLMDSTGPIHFVDVHFKPGSAQRAQRDKEARILLQLLDGIPAGEPVWIGGDFNSYSPVDAEPGSPTEPAYDLGAAPAEDVGWEPVGYLVDRGYVDAVRTWLPLDPAYTRYTTDFHPTSTDPKARIDFILRSPGEDWVLWSAETVTDGLGDQGSDHYAVFAVYRREGTTDVAAEGAHRAVAALRCWPNPFGASTTIEYAVPRPGAIALDIYSVLGRHVRSLVSGTESPADRRVRWDGTDESGRSLPAGWYYVRLAAGTDVQTTRVLLVE